MGMRHVAIKGARAGRWVPCTAKKCRNSGLHVNDETLQATRLWRESQSAHLFPLGKLTRNDVERFLSLSEDKRKLWTDKGVAIAQHDGRVNKSVRK